MPVRPVHHVKDTGNHIYGKVGVENIRHTVYENPHGTFPSQWLIETFFPEPRRERIVLASSRAAHRKLTQILGTCPAFSDYPCIAVITARRNRRTTGHRIPDGVSPLDRGVG